MSFTADGNASSNTCHYRQEALDESIGVCTNDVALCIYTRNGEGIVTTIKLHYFTRYV